MAVGTFHPIHFLIGSFSQRPPAFSEGTNRIPNPSRWNKRWIGRRGSVPLMNVCVLDEQGQWHNICQSPPPGEAKQAGMTVRWLAQWKQSCRQEGRTCARIMRKRNSARQTIWVTGQDFNIFHYQCGIQYIQCDFLLCVSWHIICSSLRGFSEMSAL